MELFAGNLMLILSLIIGSALVIVEAFIPGFGVAGFFGIVLEVIAIVSAWRNHGTVFALILTLAVLLLIGTAVFLSYRSAMKGRLSKTPLILKEQEDVSPAVADSSLSRWIGREAVTVSALRPIGFIEIDGERICAASVGALIEKGKPVMVSGVEGSHVTVRSI